jgi:LuxR family transcriptional regulator, maltose regulon positive regulatory protein
VPLDGSASFDSARVMLRAMMWPASPAQLMTDASLAVAQEPPWSPWRDTALCVCAKAHLLTADLDRAAVLFAESCRPARSRTRICGSLAAAFSGMSPALPIAAP